jgi:hypothetical protein
VRISAGAGFDASATFNAARQVITTTGDVSLFGGGGLGSLNGVRIGGIGGSTLGSTNLTLGVGGNLLLHGGSANGASLGSSAASTQANNIVVTATGNIVLESEGAGTRIGTSSQVPITPGNISVTANGSVQLGDGSAIRTLDTVSLHADQPGGTISQSGNGFVLANSLITSSHGSTSLTGPNQIANFNASSGSDVSLNNTGALTVTGLSAGGNASLDNVGTVTISGPWNAGGTSSISAIPTSCSERC